MLFCLLPVPTSFAGLQLYKAALGNCFEIEDWGPIEFSIMAKHFDRQGKPPYAYHAVRTYTLVNHLLLATHAYRSEIHIETLNFICLFGYFPAAWCASLMYAFSVFVSAISGTPHLPWAARRKRLNVGCLVGSMPLTRSCTEMLCR